MNLSLVRTIRRRTTLLGLSVALLELAASPAFGAPPWSDILEQEPAWYASAEAMDVAAAVLTYQTAVGGWPKNVSMTAPTAEPPPVRESTIDNGGTTTPLWLLARVAHARPESRPALVPAIERGLDYLFEAQYENGGWPQFFPLRRGYYSHITFNDDAMARVLRLLRAVERGEPPFDFVDEARRQRARDAVALGVACILRCQVEVDGKLTAWCAQHDAVTFAPAPARKFEPVSLSGQESVGLLEVLMAEPDPTPEIIRAVEAGVAWLDAVKLTGWRIERPPLEELPGRRDLVLVPDPGAEPLWARFYEIGTNRPIFLGRDAVVHYDLREVEPERRAGYAYYGTWGRRLLTRTYPLWRDRISRVDPQE